MAVVQGSSLPNAAPKKYRKKLGNTVFTMLFMMFLITVVYLRDWYHHLNSVVLQVEEKNTLETPRFPTVALLQDIFSSSQPELIDFKPPKCFSGGFDENAPPCETLSNEEYSISPSCNCKNSITSDLSGNFTWETQRFKYFIFTPPTNLVSKNPGYHLRLQAWFNCQYPSTNPRMAAAASAGGWLAFVQLLSWILSLQIFQE
ncbi:MAG: hypothetical protein LQ342_005537 [Letrouitia transgressa]|nr:MAG: hypothetical protein LQ342_005537 [Letrouitia transgressa]